MTIPRVSGCALALLFSLLSTTPHAAFAADAAKTYERLLKLPPDVEIEVHLEDGTRLRGLIARFDRNELVLVGRTEPIPLTEIRKVKRFRAQGQRAPWNPVTGFLPWKQAVIVAGVIVVVGLLVAYELE
jgi:hypothetical protein